MRSGSRIITEQFSDSGEAIAIAAKLLEEMERAGWTAP